LRLDEYEDFVRKSDWTSNKSLDDRIRIARYGLAAEVGSLAATLKRKVIHHSDESWNQPNEEILEELGDCLWYTAQLSTLPEGGSLNAVVRADFDALPAEIEKRPEFRGALDPANYQRFLEESAEVLENGGRASLSDYQEVAFLTARTQGRELLDVCITRLLLYATSVMSRQFPDTEYYLQEDILAFSADRTLGMLLWYLGAIATLYNTSLDAVARANVAKLEGIFNLSNALPTELHDRKVDTPPGQVFPLKFDITFVETRRGRLQMFYQGRSLGDELDDNSELDDGYRFHDVLHLANAAILGWSPVLRSLMGLKRKFSPKIDNAQDGARARIVEEAIVKAVHSEAQRAARSEGLTPEEARRRLFSDKSQIKHEFLKLIKTFAEKLEAEENQLWEWQRAIVEGHKLYSQLMDEKQGTVTVDLTNRSVSFSPLVVADVRAPVVDTSIEVFEAPHLLYRQLKEVDQIESEKIAILRLLGLKRTAEHKRLIRIAYSDEGEISVKAGDIVQERIWERAIVGFRAKWTKVGKRWVCIAMAIGTPP
jgi:NTP pyrophosphatase (non-canonical NTP hydrolase)